MINHETSARVTLWLGRCICGTLALLVFFMPRLLNWYAGIRPLVESARWGIGTGFYLSLPAVALALWSMDKLLRNILNGRIFTEENVCLIRRIRMCCAVVGLICLIAAVFYLPLIFMGVIMVFLALVVGVVKNVMAAAVELREENDLTV